MGALIRSCGLTVSHNKHNANGKRAVRCMEWDQKTDFFIKQCLQCLQRLQCLPGLEQKGFQCADIEIPMSAMSAKDEKKVQKVQTLQTYENQCLQVETPANKGPADIADIADVSPGKLSGTDDAIVI